jgi:hypothetical protein
MARPWSRHTSKHEEGKAMNDMSEQMRRKALRAHYKHVHPEAGVYLIRNSQNNKALLGSTPNLASIRNKLAFVKATNMWSALDRRLSKDLRECGSEAFSLEVLEVLDITPEMTRADILEDLSTLEQLWRERLDLSLLY